MSTANTSPINPSNPSAPPAPTHALTGAMNPAVTAGPALDFTQQSAFDLMTATLNSWGLSSLVGDLRNFIVAGDTAPDTLSLALSQTSAYKARFAGNALRLAAGVPELTPAQYIATEEQYRNVMQSYGLPAGFYDSPADFTKLIGGDVSASEIAQRAKVAHDQYMNAPQATRDLWENYFGTKGDAIAAILDPTVATQLISDRGEQVALGGAAKAQGFNISQQRAQQFQQNGVTLAAAQKAYGDLAGSLQTQNQILNRFGAAQNIGDTQALVENADLLNQGAAVQQLNQANKSEEALFAGHVGTDAQGIGISQSY